MVFTIGKSMTCTLRDVFTLYAQEFRVEGVNSGIHINVCNKLSYYVNLS